MKSPYCGAKTHIIEAALIYQLIFQEVKKKGIISVTLETNTQANVSIHHEGQFYVGTNRMILLPAPLSRKQHDF